MTPVKTVWVLSWEYTDEVARYTGDDKPQTAIFESRQDAIDYISSYVLTRYIKTVMSLIEKPVNERKA